ncbi:MAG: hypothetical protein COU85_01105 [Candidatus Portnoybacteria bacterium CG10_big_fil_rev_8_21_14_0_10_44_7]|uniref:7 transmembrane helices usually fused to an inactive transglutaminase domain-containing protein n=1 Tax=Candidatus Portnoybacteria bacterium CG10_big_fil_rev_8_21_14_0_10_44_7 TaxID=1974816 RepID=A0A2M8KJ12_9BACT|nr:MAG: hypothetical protein COU85_01105 [Candidatus Portnoybacteria bacterium CG10_big_fil_rev_8_21_14_0_10_44_7]
MFNLSQYFLSLGLPQTTLLYLLGLPVAATLIAFARQIIGIKGFGIYTSLLITLSFLVVGLKYGLVTFLVLIAAGTITRVALKKLRLSYLPRMAIVLTVVAMVLLLAFFAATVFDQTNFLQISVLAVLIMITLVEKFIAAQIDKGGKTAILLTLETIILAIAAYFLISWPAFQSLIFRFPLLTVLISLLLNILLGKWTGLRLFEYWRFRDVLKKMS